MFEKFFGTRGQSPEAGAEALAATVDKLRNTDEFKRFASIVTAERIHDDQRQEADAFAQLLVKVREEGYTGDVTIEQMSDLVLQKLG